MFLALGVAAAQLLWVQVVQAPQLTAESASQRTTRLVEPATRGTTTCSMKGDAALTRKRPAGR